MDSVADAAKGTSSGWGLTLAKLIGERMILKNYAIPILGLPRWVKSSIVLVVDISLCGLTVWLAYYLRLGEFVALSGAASLAAIASIGVALPIFALSGLYRSIFRYSGWPALLMVTRAITLYFLLYASVFTAIGIQDVPRTIGIIQPILLLMFVGGSRAMARVWLGDQYQNILKRGSRPKVLVYGAGRAGRGRRAGRGVAGQCRRAV